MNLMRQLWTDECGVIMSAEAVMLGTVGVLAMTTGVSVVSNAMNEELTDISKALRGFDQSYEVNGVRASFSGSRSGSASNVTGTSKGQFSAFKSGSGFEQLSTQDAINSVSLESFPARAARDPLAVQQDGAAEIQETNVDARRLVTEASLRSESEQPADKAGKSAKRQTRRERKSRREGER